LMRSSSAMHQRSPLLSDRSSAWSTASSPSATCPVPAKPSASVQRNPESRRMEPVSRSSSRARRTGDACCERSDLRLTPFSDWIGLR
jgi:hypothetical protein